MKILLVFLLLVLLLFDCAKDDGLKVGSFSFEELVLQPNSLDESSGLEIVNNEFISFNDGGGEPVLYQFTMSGNLSRTIHIKDIDKRDWEDIAQDSEGNLYIGDFGNSKNKRDDLVIYKVANSSLQEFNNNPSAEEITFTFPDQTTFPPIASELHFDVEAMFSKDEYLYMLTRDRSEPFVGKTRMYRVPNLPGNYEATYLDEFYTDDASKRKGQITAADISPDGKTLVMISDQYFWFCENVSENNYFGTATEKWELPVKLEMEGLVFLNDCMMYLTNEEKEDEPAAVYQVSLCD